MNFPASLESSTVAATVRRQVGQSFVTGPVVSTNRQLVTASFHSVESGLPRQYCPSHAEVPIQGPVVLMLVRIATSF